LLLIRHRYIWAKHLIVQIANTRQIQKVTFFSHQKAVHVGRKFNCPEYEYQATRKSNLVTHQESIHMGHKCGYQTSYKVDLVKHDKSVHMGQKFACPECDTQVTQKSNLATH
jgi:hypothetical protein